MADEEDREGSSSPHSSDYEEEEEEEEMVQRRSFDLQALSATSPVPDDLLKPSLADDQKIGFFSLDRAVQTEESDVVDLKEMTDVLQILLQDVASLKRDLNFAKHVMLADFETRLQKKAIELYCRVNEKISDIEKMHEERVAVVRRAFKQQLADAIARMHSMYNKNFAQRLKKEQSKKAADAGKLDEKFKEMQATIQRNESIIHMLKMQLQQFQQKAEEDDLSSYKSKSPANNMEAEALREEIQELETRISRLEEALELKDETTTQLNKDIEQLTEQLEKERIMVEQLKHEHDEMLALAEQDKASSKRLIENQKLAMEGATQERIQKAKEEALEMARKEAMEMQEADRERIRQLLEEKRLVEQLLVKEKNKVSERSQESVDVERFKRTEQKLKAEVSKLKREIEKVHKTWEKKFAILQQSLHALKDESFLRQTLQRQAATLHQASISYAMDAPLGIMPASAPKVTSMPVTPKRPLPDIPKNSKSPGDYISYTVSAPSGRGTALFSTDENQVMSDGEGFDLPPDVVPLPSPPIRSLADCAGEENHSRPSTRSHVVVLPSVQAQ